MTTPSGLFAGVGGFDVSVGGTTALTGAALASEADASRNILVTGALITANLQNASSWSDLDGCPLKIYALTARARLPTIVGCRIAPPPAE